MVDDNESKPKIIDFKSIELLQPLEYHLNKGVNCPLVQFGFYSTHEEFVKSRETEEKSKVNIKVVK